MQSQSPNSGHPKPRKQDLQDQEITVSNRFIYYYASLARRIYGMVTRREGKNVPGTHVVGPLPATDDEAPRRRPVPNKGEITLFRYRKRLLFGIPEHTQHRTVTLWAEDGRRLHVADRGLVHGCRVEAHTGDDVRAYARTVRGLSGEIDLRDIWTLTRDAEETIGFDDIAGFLWGERVDTTQTAALHLSLHHCPYFEHVTPGAYGALPEAAVRERLQQRLRHQDWEREWDELVDWFASKGSDPYDPDTFTARQRGWVQNIIDYTLHGVEADKANQTKEMLSEIVVGKKDHQRSGFNVLVRKGIWTPDENVELLRSGRQVAFPKHVLAAAAQVRTALARQPKRGRVRSAILISDAGIAMSVRRRWLWRGKDLGIHLPDVGSLVREGSVLDGAASDRMGTIQFDRESGLDEDVPMLPGTLVEALAFGSETVPAVSLYLSVDRKNEVRSVRVRLTDVTTKHVLTEDVVATVLEGASHPASAALNDLHRIALVHQQARRRAALDDTETASLTEAIQREFGILASRFAAEWCHARQVPVMYAAQESPVRAEDLGAIENPVLRRHEIRRATSPVSFEPAPEAHAGLGETSVCPISQPLHRYPDLVNLRQIGTFLTSGEAAQTSEDLDVVRFRAREELAEVDRLCHVRKRYRQLEGMRDSVGDVFGATVIHVRHDGVLVELETSSLWALVQPDQKVSAGDRLQVRVTGVDFWLRRLRASAVEWEARELEAVSRGSIKYKT